MGEVVKLPAKPLNADLARGIVQIHECLEEHRKATRDRDVVLSANIKSLDDQFEQMNGKLAHVATSVQPVVDLIADFVRWRRRIIGVLGALALAVAGSAASSIYNSLILNSHSASLATATASDRVNQQMLVDLQQMQVQQAQRSADSAINRAKQNELLTQMMARIQPPHHK